MTDQQDLRARLPELPEPLITGGNNKSDPEFGRGWTGYTGDQMRAYTLEAIAQLGRVGEPVGYVHPDTIKGLQAGLCTKSYLFAKPMPQVWADVPLYTSPQLPAGVPDGWVLVPKVPTKEMLDAGVDAAVNKAKGNPWCPYAWSAMLATAPQPDSQKSDKGGK